MEEPINISNGFLDAEITSIQNISDSTEPPEVIPVSDLNKCETLSTDEDENVDDVKLQENIDPLSLDNNVNEKSISKPDDTIIIQSDSESETNENGSQNKDEVDDFSNQNNSVSKTNGSNEKTDSENSQQELLRRSSRTVQKKVYVEENNDEDSPEESEEESDLDDITMTPRNHKAKPLIVKNTKALVEMASKFPPNQNKEPTLVILDTNHNTSHKNQLNVTPKKTSFMNIPDLRNKFAARGTTMSSVTVNGRSVSTPCQTDPPPILPSLTDDMFVVEAPSFIVPYVYEKPSMKPFRKFVDDLGKEVEEQAKKEEMLNKNKQNDLDNNEVNDAKMHDNTAKDENVSPKKKSTKKVRRVRNPNDDDDMSWDELSSELEEESHSEEEDPNIEIIKAKDDLSKNIPNVIADVNSNKTVVGERESYFNCTLGKFFINIGMNLVQEHVQKMLLDQQHRVLYKERKLGKRTTATKNSIEALNKNLELSQQLNESFTFKLKKCSICNFKTESAIVLGNHLEIPHFKNNVYLCNYCTFQTRSPHDILFHVDALHKVSARLEVAPTSYQCVNCSFEDNRKPRFSRHVLSCEKKFKPQYNLIPPLDWEPPAKIPKILQPPKNFMPTYQKGLNRQLTANSRNMFAYLSDANFINKSMLPMAGLQNSSLVRNSLLLQNANTTVTKRTTFPILNNNQIKNTAAPKVMNHQPSISIIPLPRQAPLSAQASVVKPKESYVTCEICDGFIQNLELLRSHLQWIHQLKVHPKLIQNRPPLNCQKCQFRFFTDQGLERHLLGSHGLVTTSMQEAADAGKDCGRCPICGRVYNWKLLNHVAREHKMVLKPAHLSYKCTVCTATFSQYKQFENHVYSSHAAITRNAMNKNRDTTITKTNDALSKMSNANKMFPAAKPSTSTFKGETSAADRPIQFNNYG